jgi:hypothetical protein
MKGGSISKRASGAISASPSRSLPVKHMLSAARFTVSASRAWFSAHISVLRRAE